MGSTKTLVSDINGTGALSLTDMRAYYFIAIGGMSTLLIATPPKSSPVGVSMMDEVCSTVLEHEITADLPAATQFP
ncbi:MAG: hypothetical protein B7Z02_17670 [Rhodobacterales bacterium 32-67-9]|nr:MAG: hypothetical protein B7Z02_17670 [Rhodobacterales bacterium 32-67-9]